MYLDDTGILLVDSGKIPLRKTRRLFGEVAGARDSVDLWVKPDERSGSEGETTLPPAAGAYRHETPMSMPMG